MLKACIYPWDERRKMALPGNSEETIEFCVEHFLYSYDKAIQSKGFFSVALSGGSTPKAIFHKLTAPPYSGRIDWSKVHLFWSDERSVGPKDPDSNFHMAMEAGFDKMPIPLNQIHRMQAEENIEQEAQDYENLIKKTLRGEGFDYLMLGMGEDGHTASLFPGTKALEESEKLVVANLVPQKNTLRMTLTYPCINTAKNIVIYVLGKAKQEKVLEIFSSKSARYPVEKVGTTAFQALWILDNDAAALLPAIKSP